LTRPAAIDGAAVAVLLIAGLVGFMPAYQGFGFLRPALGGLVLGGAIAWVGAWRRWSSLSVAGATVSVYFLAGGALALPATAVFGLIPNLTTVRGLAIGVVASWRQFLTATVPVEYFQEVDVVPFLVALVGTVAAASAAWRCRWPSWTMAPVAAVFIATIAMGTQETAWPLVQALAIAIVAPTWLSWRVRAARAAGDVRQDQLLRADARRALFVARVRDTAIVLAATILAGVGAFGPLTAGLNRDVARAHVVPPLDMRQYASPLVSFRSIVRDQEEAVLFDVEGLAPDARLRLAVMDAYDGLVFAVGAGRSADTGLYNKVGPVFPAPLDVAGTPARVTVTVRDYGGVWVPTAGFVSGVEFGGARASALQAELYLNAEANALVNPAGLMAEDSFSLTTVLPASPDPNLLAALTLASKELPPVEGAPDSATSVGGRFVGAATADYERVRGLVDGLVDPEHGFFSHGLADDAPSRPGHSANRIEELLRANQMIGDDEQYAAAMALMARQLGIPARVVMGFHRDPGAPGGAGEVWHVTGDDVHAWVEVAFDRVGWVAFDPTPPEDQVLLAQSPRARQEPQPEVLQPPPPPEAPAELPPQALPDDSEEDEKDEEPPTDWGPIVRLVLLIAVPILAIVAPVVAILIAKRRRSKRRRAAASASTRLSGGWREILDYATDLGTATPRASTRWEGAGLLAESFGTPGVLVLAQRADAGVFAGIEPTDAEVDDFWSDIATARREIGRKVGWWRRVRAAIAIASMRRPVARRRTAGRPVRGPVSGHQLAKKGW
jgi:hypothetical protein